jgi:hypothetical protein
MFLRKKSLFNSLLVRVDSDCKRTGCFGTVLKDFL